MSSSEMHQKNPSELDGVPDLCQMLYLNEPNVLHNLGYRYKQGKIYTSTTAKVLIAVNPYERMGNADEATLAKYQADEINLEGLLSANSLEPHVFTVAHAAYHNMVAKSANQSVIVCGESGSGKTESAKLFMKFLAYTSTVTSSDPTEFKEAQSIGKQVLDANPILESFGNAKTILNNNSSRFGKFTKMLFENRGSESARLIGAAIETYLLEKSRVVRQDKGERNYHIFYYICSQAGKHPEWLMGDGKPEDFHYLNQSGCTTFDGDSNSDKKDFEVLVDAFNTLHISKDEQQQAFRTVAGILHLGNVTFSETKTHAEGCQITNMDAVKKAAKLMQVDEKQLASRLTSRTIHVMNKSIVKPLTKEDAASNRDSIAKALFNGLFLWVVKTINKQSVPKSATSESSWIGTLDVFGFEIFENNSFEQFCINFANERLQSFFNFHVLKAEQDLYKREALIWKHIELPENQDVIDLIVGRPYGVFALLDSSNLQPKATDETFTHNLLKENKDHTRLSKVCYSPKKRRKGQRTAPRFNGFSINHYAGTVTYNAKEFLVKNSDSTHPDTVNIFNQSKSKVASQLLSSGPSADEGSRRTSMTFSSVSSVFSRQLESLMQTLAKTQPYFVRCIKPNQSKTPKNFVDEYVQPQLRCGGLIEALRIIKCGFPTRCTYERMHELFGSILSSFATPHNLNKRDFAEAIIKICGEPMDRAEYQLGLSMIFFKPGKQAMFQKLLTLDPNSISKKKRREVHRFLIKKRIFRMGGSIRAYLRLKHFRNLLRFVKAARVMTIIGKTMFRVLHKVRRRLGHKQEEADRAALLQNQKYLEALKAQEQLKAMQAAEAQWKYKLSAEREATKTVAQELDETKAMIKSLTKQVDEASARANDLEVQTSKDQEVNSELNENLRNVRNEATRLLDEIKGLETQRQKDQASFTEELSRVNSEKQQLSVDMDQQSAAKARELLALQKTLDETKEQARAADLTAEERLGELQSQFNAAKNEIHAEQEEARKLKSQLADSEEKSDRERANAALSSRQLQQELTYKQEQLQQSQRDVEEKVSEICALETDFRNTKLQLQESLDKKESEMRNREFVVEQQINTLEAERDNMQEELQRMKEKHSATKTSAEDRENELEDEMRSLKANHRTAQEQLSQQLREKDTQFAQASTQLSLLQSQYESLQQQSSSQQSDSATDLRKVRAELAQIKSDLESARAAAERDLAQEKSKSKSLGEEKYQLELEVQSFKLKEQKLEGDIRRQEDQSKHSEVANQRKLDAVQNELSTLRQSKDKLEVDMEKAKAVSHINAMKLKQKNDELNKKFSTLNTTFNVQRDEFEATISQLKREMKNFKQTSTEEYDAKLQTAASQIQELKNMVYSKNANLENLSQELQRACTNADSMKSELEASTNQVLSLESKLQQALSEAEREATRLQEELTDAEAKADASRSALTTSQTETMQLQSQLKADKAEVEAKLSEQEFLTQQAEQENTSLKSELEAANERFVLYQDSHEGNVNQLNAQLDAEKENARTMEEEHTVEMQQVKEKFNNKLQKSIARMELGHSEQIERAKSASVSAAKSATRRTNELQNELIRAKSARGIAIDKAVDFEENNRALKEQLDSKDSTIKTLETALTKQQQSSAEALKELNTKYMQIADNAQEDLQSMQTMSNKRIETLKQDTKAARAAKANLFNENLQLQRTIKTIKNKMSTMETRFSRVEKQTAEHNKMRTQAMQRRYERKITALASKVELLENQLAEQEADNSSLMQTPFLLPDELPLHMMEDSVHYVAQVDGFLAESDADFTQKAQQYEKIIAALRQKVVDLTRETRLTNEGFQALKTQATMERDLTSRTTYVNKMKAEELWENVNSNLRAEVRKLQSKNCRLKAEVVKGENRLDVSFIAESPRSTAMSPSAHSSAMSPSAHSTMSSDSFDLKKSPASSFRGSPGSRSLKSAIEPFSPIENARVLSAKEMR